jgi:hypothetical protein
MEEINNLLPLNLLLNPQKNLLLKNHRQNNLRSNLLNHLPLRKKEEINNLLLLNP